MKKHLWLAFALVFAASAEAADLKVVIDVEGMSCSLCVTAINRELRQTEGVIQAKASLKTRRAEVVVPEDFPAQTLLDAIAKTGYIGKVADIQRIPE
jgi:mercuric ion binding protein